MAWRSTRASSALAEAGVIEAQYWSASSCRAVTVASKAAASKRRAASGDVPSARRTRMVRDPPAGTVTS